MRASHCVLSVLRPLLLLAPCPRPPAAMWALAWPAPPPPPLPPARPHACCYHTPCHGSHYTMIIMFTSKHIYYHTPCHGSHYTMIVILLVSTLLPHSLSWVSVHDDRHVTSKHSCEVLSVQATSTIEWCHLRVFSIDSHMLLVRIASRACCWSLLVGIMSGQLHCLQGHER